MEVLGGGGGGRWAMGGGGLILGLILVVLGDGCWLWRLLVVAVVFGWWQLPMVWTGIVLILF